MISHSTIQRMVTHDPKCHPLGIWHLELDYKMKHLLAPEIASLKTLLVLPTFYPVSSWKALASKNHYVHLRKHAKNGFIVKFVIIIFIKRLDVHRTTLWASSSHARVSLESFSSTSEDHLRQKWLIPLYFRSKYERFSKMWLDPGQKDCSNLKSSLDKPSDVLKLI